MRDAPRTDGTQLATIRALAETSPAATVLLRGPALRLCYCNAAFAAFAGRPEAALSGLTLAEALPGLAAGTELARLGVLRVSGGTCHLPAAALPCGPPGRRWDIEATTLGPPPGDLLVQLREAPGHAAQALVEALALATWSTGPDGRPTGPEGLAVLTGQSPAQAAGRGWLDALQPEDRDAVWEAWLAALAAGRPSYGTAYRIAQPGGSWRWAAARGIPLHDAQGGIQGWTGANTVPGELRPTAALQASEARFRTLAEGIPHLLWQTDARGEPDYVNARWQDATGLDLAQTREGGWLAAVHPEDVGPLAAAWGRALAEGGDCDAELRIRHAAGAYRWHRLCAAPVRDAVGKLRHWVGTCTDTEARHAAEARLRQSLATQDGLVREAEHRIRNSLQLVASLLRLQAGRVTDPAAREALEAATGRVQAVAEAHRALQRSPDLRSLRLGDMLRELAAGAAAQHPGADIRVAAPDGLGLDAERAIPLALALAELLAAALRRGATGAVRLTAWEAADGTLTTQVAAPGDPLLEAGDTSLGATVIQALAKQIGAQLEVGAAVTLRLAAEQAAAAAA